MFTLDVFGEMPPGKAYMAHYKCKSMAVADACASRLLKNAKIVARLAELNAKVEKAKVASYQERQEILTEIARGRLTDFMECGQDGTWLNIDSKKMNTHAIQGIDSKTEYDDNGSKPTVVTKIKLHNPINAIAELNKMDHVYEPESKTIVDNRTINIIVESKDDQENLNWIKNGMKELNGHSS